MKRTIPLLILGAWLVSCGNTSVIPQTPTFTLRLEPSVLNLRVTETGIVKVIVARSGGFAEAVIVSLGNGSTGLETAPVTITGTEGTLSIHATDAATIGTNAPLITGTSTTVTRTETLIVRIAKAVAVVSNVTVQGGSQARQGVGTVVLTVAGSNLERVGAVKLGDLETMVRPGRTATALEVQAIVPHGASLGAKDLVLKTEGGDTTLPAVLTVTAISAAPAGSDAGGAGTLERPYRSLKKALSASQAGDTVHLANGTYNAANGETWPTISNNNATGSVPAGVSLEGESVAGTVLEGPGAGGSTAGLMFVGDVQVKNVTAKGFAVGFEVESGTVSLENILSQGNSVGLRAMGGTTKLTASEIKANTISGVLAFGTATLEVTGGSSHDNAGYGYSLSNSAKLKATNLEAYKNSVGVGQSDQGEATLTGSKLHDNKLQGLATSSPSLATVSVSGCELYANASGLEFGGKSLIVRGTIIRDNIQAGLVVTGLPERVDLGTFTEAGNNDLHGNSVNSTTPQIMDARLYPEKLDHVVFTASATKLNGTFPKPDIYVGQYDSLPYFSISATNTTIQFF